MKRKIERWNLRSLGMNTSTTFPYLSKSGNRSSAVVPGEQHQELEEIRICRAKRDGNLRERNGNYGKWCWERVKNRYLWCPEDRIVRSATWLPQRERAVENSLGFVFGFGIGLGLWIFSRLSPSRVFIGQQANWNAVNNASPISLGSVWLLVLRALSSLTIFPFFGMVIKLI